MNHWKRFAHLRVSSLGSDCSSLVLIWYLKLEDVLPNFLGACSAFLVTFLRHFLKTHENKTRQATITPRKQLLSLCCFYSWYSTCKITPLEQFRPISILFYFGIIPGDIVILILVFIEGRGKDFNLYMGPRWNSFSRYRFRRRRLIGYRTKNSCFLSTFVIWRRMYKGTSYFILSCRKYISRKKCQNRDWLNECFTPLQHN